MEEILDDDYIVCASPFMLNDTCLLGNGDGTFTYKELLFYYHELEENFSRSRSLNNCWPSKIFIQKLFASALRLKLSPITTHSSVSILRQLCVIDPEYVKRQNPEVLTFVCLCLAAKMNERRRRWVYFIYQDTILTCSKRQFKCKELEVLQRIDYRLDVPVPMHYVNLFLEAYFNNKLKLTQTSTNVCHLLYSAPEKFISCHSSFVLGVVVLCVSQSIIEGSASDIMMKWSMSLCTNPEEVRCLCNDLFAFIFKTEDIGHFRYQ
ncbi:Cyclin-like domain-containing protein [Entamoeba marina]